MHSGTLQNTTKHVKLQTTDQKVSGSNPLGRASLSRIIARMLPLKHRTIWKKKIDDHEKNGLIVRIVKEQPAEKIAKSELSRQNSVISTDVSGIVFSASNQR